MLKIVQQSVELPALPAVLYSMYLDPGHWPVGSGSVVALAQVDVPERLYDTLLGGWPTRYWEPWRAYLRQAT